MVDILVLGDINADLAASISGYPAEGDDSQMHDLRWCSGGAAVNTATALALLGSNVGLVGRVGPDPAASIALGAALQADVDLRLLQRDRTVATGLCLAAISPSGQRTFFSFRGANVELDPALLKPADLAGVRLVHVCGHSLLEEPQRLAALRAFELAGMGALLSLDLCSPAARRCADLIMLLLPRLNALFMNEDELSFLLPGQSRDEALDRLLDHGVPLVVLKRGAAGCIVAAGGTRSAHSAVEVEVRDTNGCGDAFVAGFLWAYLQGTSLPGCAALGNLLGGLTATRVGAADALPTAAELQAHMGSDWAAKPQADPA